MTGVEKLKEALEKAMPTPWAADGEPTWGGMALLYSTAPMTKERASIDIGLLNPDDAHLIVMAIRIAKALASEEAFNQIGAEISDEMETRAHDGREYSRDDLAAILARAALAALLEAVEP